MNILILGGTGTMGTYLVEQLAVPSNYIVVTSRSVKVSENPNIKYIKGNARDINFLNEVLQEQYDVIVDFMIYTTKEFEDRCDLFLSNTSQYVFLSSARVYAESNKPLTEKSPRLLDISEDKEYLNTDEYALAKARQEDVLTCNKKKNWTIIRPYITYNSSKLQLGTYEKEYWLYRALHNRPIVLSKDIKENLTTLTYGKDVSKGICTLINNKKALGEIFQITTSDNLTWGEVLECYLKVIEKEYAFKPNVKWIENSTENNYQFKYDRIFNRIFDSKKITTLTKDELKFKEPLLGLEKCLVEFIKEGQSFHEIDWTLEAKKDKICGVYTPLSEIHSHKGKIKYVLFRFAPNLAKFVIDMLYNIRKGY